MGTAQKRGTSGIQKRASEIRENRSTSNNFQSGKGAFFSFFLVGTNFMGQKLEGVAKEFALQFDIMACGASRQQQQQDTLLLGDGRGRIGAIARKRDGE